VRRGALRLEALSVEDVPQLDELLARYERMDFADATLVLIAEKTGITEIFPVDRRDFEVYRTRSGRRFRLLLASSSRASLPAGARDPRDGPRPTERQARSRPSRARQSAGGSRTGPPTRARDIRQPAP